MHLSSRDSSSNAFAFSSRISLPDTTPGNPTCSCTTNQSKTNRNKSTCTLKAAIFATRENGSLRYPTRISSSTCRSCFSRSELCRKSCYSCNKVKKVSIFRHKGPALVNVRFSSLKMRERLWGKVGSDWCDLGVIIAYFRLRSARRREKFDCVKTPRKVRKFLLTNIRAIFQWLVSRAGRQTQRKRLSGS